jgi:hypothetical protein
MHSKLLICIEKTDYLMYFHQQATSHNNSLLGILVDSGQNINTEKSVVKKIIRANELIKIRRNDHTMQKVD